MLIGEINLRNVLTFHKILHRLSHFSHSRGLNQLFSETNCCQPILRNKPLFKVRFRVHQIQLFRRNPWNWTLWIFFPFEETAAILLGLKSMVGFRLSVRTILYFGTWFGFCVIYGEKQNIHKTKLT